MRIIMLPMLFGSSLSFERRAGALWRAGHYVQIIDLYEGQKIKRPAFLPFMIKNKGSEAAIDDLAMSLDEKPIFDQISQALSQWHDRPSVLIGTSIGGSYAMRYAQSSGLISAVVAISARIKYPSSAPPERLEPELSEIHCPLMLNYGRKEDFAVMFGTKLREIAPNVTFTSYDGGHGFDNRYIQGRIPSPFYNGASARAVWSDIEAWLKTNVSQLT